ncbi:unannotated protein [freshwater metagenome]|uniref:Unannotated protein n=1 Tax=freshwater metagenome TaxID=449393 RepID=A0A6J7FWK0_9ZZZZ|nr:hypothetical protein [Actinomycetota bacterium]
MSDLYDQRRTAAGQTALGAAPDADRLAQLEADRDELLAVARLLLHGAGVDRRGIRDEAGGWVAAVYPVDHLRRRAEDCSSTSGQHTFWLTNAQVAQAADVLERFAGEPDGDSR